MRGNSKENSVYTYYFRYVAMSYLLFCVFCMRMLFPIPEFQLIEQVNVQIRSNTLLQSIHMNKSFSKQSILGRCFYGRREREDTYLALISLHVFILCSANNKLSQDYRLLTLAPVSIHGYVCKNHEKLHT